MNKRRGSTSGNILLILCFLFLISFFNFISCSRNENPSAERPVQKEEIKLNGNYINLAECTDKYPKLIGNIGVYPGERLSLNITQSSRGNSWSPTAWAAEEGLSVNIYTNSTKASSYVQSRCIMKTPPRPKQWTSRLGRGVRILFMDIEDVSVPNDLKVGTNYRLVISGQVIFALTTNSSFQDKSADIYFAIQMDVQDKDTWLSKKKENLKTEREEAKNHSRMAGIMALVFLVSICIFMFSLCKYEL